MGQSAGGVCSSCQMEEAVLVPADIYSTGYQSGEVDPEDMPLPILPEPKGGQYQQSPITTDDIR